MGIASHSTHKVFDRIAMCGHCLQIILDAYRGDSSIKF